MFCQSHTLGYISKIKTTTKRCWMEYIFQTPSFWNYIYVEFIYDTKLLNYKCVFSGQLFIVERFFSGLLKHVFSRLLPTVGSYFDFSVRFTEGKTILRPNRCIEHSSTRFFYKERYFSTQLYCCLTFSRIVLQMLLRCFLLQITIIILRYILYLVYLCLRIGIGLFMPYLRDLLFILSLIFIAINHKI